MRPKIFIVNVYRNEWRPLHNFKGFETSVQERRLLVFFHGTLTPFVVQSQLPPKILHCIRMRK